MGRFSLSMIFRGVLKKGLKNHSHKMMHQLWMQSSPLFLTYLIQIHSVQEVFLVRKYLSCIDKIEGLREKPLGVNIHLRGITLH
jgi:hypothetical protein